MSDDRQAGNPATRTRYRSELASAGSALQGLIFASYVALRRHGLPPNLARLVLYYVPTCAVAIPVGAFAGSAWRAVYVWVASLIYCVEMGQLRSLDLRTVRRRFGEIAWLLPVSFLLWIGAVSTGSWLALDSPPWVRGWYGIWTFLGLMVPTLLSIFLVARPFERRRRHQE